jgi:hypothetical protein
MDYNNELLTHKANTEYINRAGEIFNDKTVDINLVRTKRF